MPHLPDLYGDAFAEAYEKTEADKLYHRQVKATDLYARMMRSLAETGKGWMTFKHATNLKCNQTGKPGNVVHLSNLCTEITEVTSKDQTAVCNLGSINLARHVATDGEGRPVFRTAVPMLDRVIDINYYPIAQLLTLISSGAPLALASWDFRISTCDASCILLSGAATGYRQFCSECPPRVQVP